MHELLHALGFYHEQSRPDRDDYIRILWNNIIPDLKYNFNKATNGNMLNAPYDTCSLMHYGPMALSANGKPTIILKRNPVSPNTCPTIGNRNYLSNIDIRQLNTFYECKVCITNLHFYYPLKIQRGGGDKICPYSSFFHAIFL